MQPINKAHPGVRLRLRLRLRLGHGARAFWAFVILNLLTCKTLKQSSPDDFCFPEENPSPPKHSLPPLLPFPQFETLSSLIARPFHSALFSRCCLLPPPLLCSPLPFQAQVWSFTSSYFSLFFLFFPSILSVVLLCSLAQCFFLLCFCASLLSLLSLFSPSPCFLFWVVMLPAASLLLCTMILFGGLFQFVVISLLKYGVR